MDYKNIIDIILIALTILEQFLSYLPNDMPHSTLQLIIFVIMKLMRCKKKRNQDIIILENI